MFINHIINYWRLIGAIHKYLCEVDFLAGEHGLPRRLHLPRARQVEEEPEHLVVDPVLGEVDQDVAILGRWQHLAESMLISRVCDLLNNE